MTHSPLSDVLDELAPELLAGVEETMAPTTVALPLRRTLERLPGLMRDLVERLRSGRLDEPEKRTDLPIQFDIAPLVTALRLLKHSIYALIDTRQVPVTTRDVRIIGDWFSAVAESALAAENRRFSDMLDTIPDHMMLHNADGVLIYVNRATAEVARWAAGLSPEEVLGRRVIDIVRDKAFGQMVDENIKRVLAGEVITEEFVLPHPDGGRWNEHHVLPLHGPDGKIEAIATASRSIHARKKAEARLQLLSKIGLLAETHELDTILGRAAGLAIPELADWSVFELLHEGKIVRSTVAHPDAVLAERAEHDLLESRRAAPTRVDWIEYGGRLYQVGNDDDALAEADPALHALLRRFEAGTAIVTPFFVMGAPIAVATLVFGRESGRRHAASDLEIADEIARRAAQIVENARLQSEVSEALAHRERVMGILGHDLRNPVTAVLSLSASLSQRADVPDRAREGLRHMHKAAERMEQMIATILDFTQLRFRGVPSLALEAFDLETLVRTIVDELRAAHPGRTITIEARGELRGRWDFSRMGQVISNLVGNALTHGIHDTPVTVSLAPDEDSVVVAVTNLGATISPDVLGKLFEPFWQAPQAGATRSRGLGLGLFIVDQIVQAHGGEITVRSQHDEIAFIVRLPR